MSINNKAILIGRVGRDPESRQLSNDVTMVTFSIATSKKIRDEERTQWHSCKAFRKTAELIEKYVAKGDLIAVEGEIEYNETDDGKRFTNIVVHQVEFLRKKGDGRQHESRHEIANAHEEKSAKEIVATSPEESKKILEESGDDLPF